MASVTVDGVTYVPEGASRPSIGVGITTHNRNDLVQKVLGKIQDFTPGAKIVVVDDASPTPVPNATYRFNTNVGIAAAKNKCLELLDDCEHIFLFDDDAWPQTEDWWRPYVESPEPHLMAIFQNKSKDIEVIYDDGVHIAWTGPRGHMLYVHRSVLDVVGGFDIEYVRWGYEHGDFSSRIHNAGLTTFRYADVVGSDKLIHSMDKFEETPRTVTTRERNKLVDENGKRHRENWLSAEYKEYKQAKDVVITTLLTSLVDPQRGNHMKPDFNLLKTLADSVKTKLVVLNDQLTEDSTDKIEFVTVPARIQPYFQRWLSAWQYLRDHPEVGRVWIVDGTDVEMLRDPFPEMQEGRLYVGYEPTVVGCDWMRNNHKAEHLTQFMNDNHSKPLLNAGLVGGSRETVMEFIHAVFRQFTDQKIRYSLWWDRQEIGIGDMAAFNYVAYTMFGSVIETGPKVCTTFKANERNTWSWWKHK